MDACHFVMDGSHQLVKCHQRLLKSRLRPLDPRSAPQHHCNLFFSSGTLPFRPLYYLGRLLSPGPPVQQAPCHRWTANKRNQLPKIWSRLPGEKVRLCFAFDPLGVGRVVGTPFFFPALHQTRTSVCWLSFALENVAVSSSADTTAHFTVRA